MLQRQEPTVVREPYSLMYSIFMMTTVCRWRVYRVLVLRNFITEYCTYPVFDVAVAAAVAVRSTSET